MKMAECEASFAGTSCGTSTCSDSIRLEMVASLQARREELEAKLAAKNEELKLLCMQEAEITGVLPPEIPLEPGETPPTLRRRVGTSFALPEGLLNKLYLNEEESLGAVELEIKIQTGIAEAALGLANDSSQSKAVRRKHRLMYQQSQRRLSELETKLSQLRVQQQQGGGSRSQSPAQQAQPQTQIHTQAYQLQLKQRKKPRPPIDSGTEENDISESDGVLHAGGISLSPLGALDRHEPGRLHSALSASTNTVGLPLHPPRHSSYHNTSNQYPTLGACTNAELERFGRRDVVQSGDGLSSSSSSYWGSTARQEIPSPSGSRYSRGRYQPGLHGELEESGRSSSQRWKRERCSVAVSMSRFGSLDRRRATNCDEIDSAVPALLPSQTYPEHTLGHSLVRTQSLGSVESSRPRHPMVDRDPNAEPYPDRKTKEKEWYETSLDAPPATTPPNVTTTSSTAASSPAASITSTTSGLPTDTHSHPPLQASLSHPQPNMYQSQSHPQALAQTMYQSHPTLPSHPPYHSNVYPPLHPKLHQTTSTSHLSLHLPSHPPSPHLSSSHPPAVPPHLPPHSSASSHNAPYPAAYHHKHSPQPPQPPPLPPPPNANPSPPLLPPHSRPHSHHSALMASQSGSHPGPALPPHPPHTPHPPHLSQSHQSQPLQTLQSHQQAQSPQQPQPPHHSHSLQPSQPAHSPQQPQPPHHPHPLQPSHPSQRAHSPQQPQPPHHPHPHQPSHPSQRAHSPQQPQPPHHPHSLQPSHPSQRAHSPQQPQLPYHPHPVQPSQRAHSPQQSQLPHHPAQQQPHPPQQHNLQHHHPSQTTHPVQSHPHQQPYSPTPHAPQQPHPMQQPQQPHPSQQPHPMQQSQQPHPMQQSQHPQQPHPPPHHPPPAHQTNHAASHSPVPPQQPGHTAASGIFFPEEPGGHSQLNIPFESPKNLMVVQQGSWQPYREVTKPFEMSDFYKYSTKFRKQMQQSPPLTAQSPQSPQSTPALQQKGVYQPLQPLTCQPLEPPTATRPPSCTAGLPTSPENVITSPGAPMESVADAFSSEMLAWFREQRGPPAPNAPASSGPPPRSATLV